MEIISEYNKIPILVTPLMHRDVVKSRAASFLYPAVLARIQRDRVVIDAFLRKVRPYAHHVNLEKITDKPTATGEPFWGNQWFDNGDARAAMASWRHSLPKGLSRLAAATRPSSSVARSVISG